MTTHPPPPGRRAFLVWGVAVAAYVVAVMNRSSLGVATLETADRYGLSASFLASLAVAQLVVYAALQIPVGVLLDRFGPRALICTGAVLMATGQLLVALTSVAPGVLAGRVLIGAGDALTFVSVIRLVPAWFPSRRVPLMTQLTGVIGQLGQVLSAVPLVAVLHSAGWTAAFTGVAAVGVVAGAAVLAVVRDTPGAVLSPGPATGSPPARLTGTGLQEVLADPGSRLGFWVHFVCGFSSHVIVLLWGFSFFVEGEGRSHAEASALLTVNVLASVVVGPVLGELTARRPDRRVRTVLVVAACMAVGWLVVLVPGRPVPLVLLGAFVVLTAIGGPTSLIGFDVARSTAPARRLGTATGLVNTGGFVAALTTMFVIGVVLDHAAGTGDRDLHAYRLALSVVVVPWVVGVTGVLVEARRTRRRYPGLAV
ncbi:MAG TPA: MFS transporter [Cellulomonas sp.]